MEPLALRRPDPSFSAQIAAYRQEFLAAGDSLDGCASLRSMPDPQDWLAQAEALADPRTVPPAWVQSTQFLCVRETDGRLAGMIQVRHRFNGFLERFGGHIGYSVRPSERGKGVATRMLRDCLPFCRGIGLSRVLITCNEDNAASRRVILKNGGVYESTVFEPEEGVRIERYWIGLG